MPRRAPYFVRWSPEEQRYPIVPYNPCIQTWGYEAYSFFGVGENYRRISIDRTACPLCNAKKGEPDKRKHNVSSFLSRSCGLVVRQPLGGASRFHQTTHRGRKCPTGAGVLASRGTHPVEAPAFLHGVLHDVGAADSAVLPGLTPGEAGWFGWLDGITSFAFYGRAGVHCTVRKETIQRGGAYWYAYRSVQRRTVKHYIGRTNDLSILSLEEVTERCTMHHLLI